MSADNYMKKTTTAQTRGEKMNAILTLRRVNVKLVLHPLHPRDEVSETLDSKVWSESTAAAAILPGGP